MGSTALCGHTNVLGLKLGCVNSDTFASLSLNVDSRILCVCFAILLDRLILSLEDKKICQKNW